MGLLYSKPVITKKNDTLTPKSTDPDLVEAIQIIKNRKWEKYKKVCATDFCFRVVGVLSLSPEASNSTKELKDIIDDVQRVYDDLKN